jgi:uncharacterized protein with PIN domain
VIQGSHARPERSAQFRFYEELNDFLPACRRKVSFTHLFAGTPAIRDVIQAIGVPHTAVDLVLVDGRPVDFAHRLRGGERVAVYPVFERLDISPLQRLRPQPLREPRFILDVHLGKLARYLRMLGFDTLYRDDWDDDELIDRALEQRRIVLTRDIGILKQKRVSHGYWLRNTDPEQQLQEVVAALDLRRQLQPFTRCLECNGVIRALQGDPVASGADPDIAARFDRFWQCESCRRLYWKGSHYRRMLRSIRRMLPADADALRPGPP